MSWRLYGTLGTVIECWNATTVCHTTKPSNTILFSSLYHPIRNADHHQSKWIQYLFNSQHTMCLFSITFLYPLDSLMALLFDTLQAFVITSDTVGPTPGSTPPGKHSLWIIWRLCNVIAWFIVLHTVSENTIRVSAHCPVLMVFFNGWSVITIEGYTPKVLISSGVSAWRGNYIGALGL